MKHLLDVVLIERAIIRLRAHEIWNTAVPINLFDSHMNHDFESTLHDGEVQASLLLKGIGFAFAPRRLAPCLRLIVDRQLVVAEVNAHGLFAFDNEVLVRRGSHLDAFVEGPEELRSVEVSLLGYDLTGFACCWIHEDCRVNPELGEACLASRMGLGQNPTNALAESILQIGFTQVPVIEYVTWTTNVPLLDT